MTGRRLMTLVMGPELERSVHAQIIGDSEAVCAQMDKVKDIGPTWMNSLLIADLEIPQCFNAVRYPNPPPLHPLLTSPDLA